MRPTALLLRPNVREAPRVIDLAGYAVTKWTSLTRIPLKAQLYERETYFREGSASAVDILGEDVQSALMKAALLIVKPDGMVSGKASTVVNFLRANNFCITAAELLTFTSFHWRELWRYQLTSATLDRLAVNDLVLRGSALLLMLRHEGHDVPASVRLSGLKGPSDVSAQQPGCLRRLLDQPNRVLSFIHVADEPADVLRELAIFIDEPTRRRVLTAFADGTISPADQKVLDEALESSDAMAMTLDSWAALRRVEKALRRVGSRDSAAAAQRALTDLKRMRRGERILWHPFAKALAATGICLDRWDVATLGASFIVYDEPGMSKLIKAVDAKLWSRETEV